MSNNKMAADHNNSRSNNKAAEKEAAVIPTPIVDEGPSPYIQQGVAQKNLVPAQINFLDYTKKTFHVNRKAKGSVLIDLVAAQLNLKEKDYFGLAYYDQQKIQHWLYPSKRIVKQLKDLAWEFWFQVKFYPPQPAQLSEDLTRYLLYLQLRRDVHTERLPVSFAGQANLGSLVAQATLGDYQPVENYVNHLSSARIAQPTSEQEQFISRVRELHRQHRGLTPQEAELNYLNECKALAMYGVHLFQAKDSKGKPVQIGVNAHGISVYSDQMRIHRFAWPGIIKFSYRRNNFSVKLKPGELDPKKEASVTYHLSSYEHAKLLWKCAVEHHGFFRLIQPEAKPKGSLFSFGSTRFRYTGRTNIQSQMASQLFVAPTAADRTKSKSVDQIAQKGPKEHSSPLNYADEATPEKFEQKQKSASVYYQEVGVKEDKKKAKGKKQKDEKKTKAKQRDQKSTSASSSTSSSSSSDAEAEEIHVLVHDEKQQQMHENVKEENLITHAPENLNYSLPHTTTRTWHEQSAGPEQITTEVDEHGNLIKRIVKTEHVKHTIQTQSYQTVAVEDNTNKSHVSSPPPPPQRLFSPQNLEQRTENIVTNGNASDSPGELISTKVVTTGNRTIETLTYKKEKDGATETRVEHRITIHANEPIDHDAELNRAILEATSMNPNMKVEKIEVERGSNG